MHTGTCSTCGQTSICLGVGDIAELGQVERNEYDEMAESIAARMTPEAFEVWKADIRRMLAQRETQRDPINPQVTVQGWHDKLLGALSRIAEGSKFADEPEE